MALQEITYTDKVDLEETSVADINKTKASDLNEIKSVVNNNKTEVANYIGWTYLGETTGDAIQSLPSGWRELYATSSFGGSATVCINWYVLKDDVDNGRIQYRNGFYLTSTNNMGASIYFSDNASKVKLLESYNNGSSVIATQTTHWFYR